MKDLILIGHQFLPVLPSASTAASLNPDILVPHDAFRHGQGIGVVPDRHLLPVFDKRCSVALSVYLLASSTVHMRSVGQTEITKLSVGFCRVLQNQFVLFGQPTTPE
jgi:hypothetical protein